MLRHFLRFVPSVARLRVRSLRKTGKSTSGTTHRRRTGRNPAGEALGPVCASSRKKPSVELCRLAVDFAPNGIVAVNATGEIVLINSETEKLFRYTREELIGRPLEMLVPNLEVCRCGILSGAALAGEDGRIECHGRRKSGEVF